MERIGTYNFATQFARIARGLHRTYRNVYAFGGMTREWHGTDRSVERDSRTLRAGALLEKAPLAQWLERWSYEP